MTQIAQKIFYNGYAAFRNGESFVTNPHPKESAMRTMWYNGWYSAQSDDKLGHLWDAYDIPYMKDHAEELEKVFELEQAIIENAQRKGFATE